MSNYPISIDVFSDKLNMRGELYVIQDEIVPLVDGVGEKFLIHDNVKHETLEVWSGPGKTGVKIAAHILTNPQALPWKTIIRVYAETEQVYVTYETYGDQVEAEDINNVQDAIITTQTEFDRHKADAGVHSNTFVHNQLTPSNTWVINHNLGRYPSVTIVDSANSVVVGDIAYDSTNVITVRFQGVFSGSAYLN